MSLIARRTRWVKIEDLTTPTLNNEFDNIVNWWNFHDQGLSKWQQIKTSGNLSVDGTTTLTGAMAANIAMGGFKLTGLGAGTGNGDSLRFEQLKVIQVVAATNTTAFSTTSSTFQTTNLSASITPTSASNRILVFTSGTLRSARLDLATAYASIFRGSTNLGGGTSSSIGVLVGPVAGTVIQNVDVPCTLSIVDSPASTSSLIYSVKIANNDNVNTVVWGNQSLTSIILMEVV